MKSMLSDIWPAHEVAKVRYAHSLKDARSAIERKAPDCVLLDLVLPDSSGIDSLVGLQEVDQSVPIVVLCSNAERGLARRAIEAGAQDFLVRGTVGSAGLAQAIEFAIGRRSYERNLQPRLELPDTALAARPSEFAQPEGSVALGVAILDEDGTIMFSSPELADRLGYRVDEIVGCTKAELVHPNDLSEYERILASSNDCGSIRYMHACGQPIFLRIDFCSLVGKGGKVGVAVYSLAGPEGSASSGAFVRLDWG